MKTIVLIESAHPTTVLIKKKKKKNLKTDWVIK